MNRLVARRLQSIARLAAVASLVAAGGLLVVWAGRSPLSGAVVATARLRADLGHKTVRHEEGGIVRSILVRDGDLVHAGQPLIVIGVVRNDAEVRLLLDQLQRERIRSARAATEAALGARFEPSADIGRSTKAAEHFAREAALFAARRRTLDERVASLAARVRDTHAQAAALNARIAQARSHYQQLAADEARESAARIREVEQRLRSFRHMAERQQVRAPADGRVLGLRVSSVGQVIGPGDPLLDVVPTRGTLLIEAQVRPQDIAHVHEGAATEVRLDARATPRLAGKVVLVSADRVTSPGSGASWYAATVEIDVDELAQHPEIVLRPGMPAELVIAAPNRTLFQLLAMPLDSFASKAMREP